MSKFILMILLLVVASGTATAEWVKVYSTKEWTDYVNPTTIRRSSEKVKMWGLRDFVSASFSILSAKTHFEFDCKKKQARALYLIIYSGNMGRDKDKCGHYFEDPTWSPLSSEPEIEASWKFACMK